MKLNPITIQRGQLLDDLTFDFGDYRGEIGFARMTPDEQALLCELIPPTMTVVIVPGNRDDLP